MTVSDLITPQDDKPMTATEHMNSLPYCPLCGFTFKNGERCVVVHETGVSYHAACADAAVERAASKHYEPHRMLVPNDPVIIEKMRSLLGRPNDGK